MANLFKKYGWHLAVLLSALLITIAFVPQVLDNKQIKQHDITQYKGSIQETNEYEKIDGKTPLWSNSMFSGMPVYLAIKFNGNIFTQVNTGLRSLLPAPAALIFMMFAGFLVMGWAMRFKPLVNLLGAIAYTFSTYNIVILAAGHNSKVNALVFLPVMLGGLYHAYRFNAFRGAAIFGFGLVLDLVAGHPQMTYYFGFLAIVFVMSEAIGAFKEKTLKNFALASALLALMTLLSAWAHYSNLTSINEYSKYSTRGKSELTKDANNQTDGLDRSYITDWSNGIDESFSLLIPNFKGGPSDAIGNHKEAIKEVNTKMRDTIAGQNAYWGDQPFTGGPAYAGAFVCVLFLIGLFFVKDRIKWPLLIAGIITLVLSWGKNIPGLTNFFLDYFPMYSKFRAVASMVVIPDLVIPVLAAIVIMKLLNENELPKTISIFGKDTGKSPLFVFLSISGIVAAFCAILWIAPTALTNVYADGEYEKFSSSIDAQFVPDIQKGLMTQGDLESFKTEFFSEIEKARVSILKADAFRSLVFILLGMAIVGFYLKKPYNKTLMLAMLTVLFLADLFVVNKRYLNDSNFVAKRKNASEFPLNTADQFILNDKGHNNRVLNFSVSPFNDATTSYYHKSIGGYHGAKLKKYQELIQYGIQGELAKIQETLQVNPTQMGIDGAMQHSPILNMLNTKYFIFNPQSAPYINPFANGNAWFVEDLKIAKNADEELDITISMDSKTTAVTQESFASMLTKHTNGKDSLASIKLSSYHPDRMEYDAITSSPKLAVFSEVWYPEWKVFIDGQEAEIAKVNYTLRGVVIPAGTHKVEMVFKTKHWERETISRAGSIILLLVGLAFLLGNYIPGLKRFYKEEEH